MCAQATPGHNSPQKLVPIRPAIANLPAYVPGARPQAGVTVHRLASNENPYPPLASVTAQLTPLLESINRYPDMAASELHDALATFLSGGARTQIHPANVAIGNGSVALLQHIISAFVGPDDAVVYPWRSFEAYPIVVDVAGGTSVQVPLDGQDAIDVSAMASAIDETTRVVILCTPNNPTGSTLTHTQVTSLLNQIPEDVLVVIDEAYVEFVHCDDPVRGLDLVADYPNVVVLRTFSKAYGLAGLRVGYAVADERVIAAIRATATPFGVSTIAQQAAVLSMAAFDELSERVSTIVAERERLVTALRDSGWYVPDTQANFVWLRLGDESLSFAQAARDEGILVRPFAGEGVRVSIGDRDDNDALLAFAAQWKSRSK